MGKDKLPFNDNKEIRGLFEEIEGLTPENKKKIAKLIVESLKNLKLPKELEESNNEGYNISQDARRELAQLANEIVAENIIRPLATTKPQLHQKSEFKNIPTTVATPQLPDDKSYNIGLVFGDGEK